MSKINIGKGEYKFCPICGRSKGAFCFINDEVYYDKQRTQRDPDGKIVVCYRSKNAEKMATSGTTFVSLNEPGDCSLAISGADGSQWAFIHEQKGGDQASGYVWCLFQDIASYRRQQEYWAKRTGKGKSSKTYRKEFVPIVPQVAAPKEPETAPTQRLNEVYSALLDLLVIEDWTQKALKGKDGWDDEMYSYLTEEYKIRTLPPPDKERFSDEKLIALYKKSPTRKSVMEKLIEKVGEPIGVPGFQYYETEGKKKWTISGQGGYIIPVFDPRGYIVRLRLRLSEEAIRNAGIEAYENKLDNFFETTRRGFEKFSELMTTYCGDIETCQKVLAFGEEYEVERPEGDELAAARYDELLEAAAKRYAMLENQWGLYSEFYSEHNDAEARKKARYYFLENFFGGDENKAIKHYASKGGKYKWLSSNEKYGGTPSHTVCGFYGIEWLEDYKQGEVRAVVTEGEKKGMVASYYLGYLFVTLPGVAQFDLLKNQKIEAVGGKTAFEWLKSIGVTTIAVANDADMLTNANVFEATKGLCRLIHEEGFICEIAEWSETGGKGIDDACIAGEEIEFQEMVF